MISKSLNIGVPTELNRPSLMGTNIYLRLGVVMAFLVVLTLSVSAVTYDNVSTCWSGNLTNNSVYNLVPDFNVTQQICFYSPYSVNVTFDCQGGRINTNDFSFVFFPWNAGPEYAGVYDMGDVYYKLQNCTFYGHNTSQAYNLQTFALYNSSSTITLEMYNNDFNGTTLSLYAPISNLQLKNNQNMSIIAYSVPSETGTGSVNSGNVEDNSFYYLFLWNFYNVDFDRNSESVTAFDYINFRGLNNTRFRNNTMNFGIGIYELGINNSEFTGNTLNTIQIDGGILNSEFIGNTLDDIAIQDDGVWNSDFIDNTMNGFSITTGDDYIDNTLFDGNTFNSNVYTWRFRDVWFLNNDFYGRLYSNSAAIDVLVQNNTFNNIGQNDITFPYSRNTTIIYNTFDTADLVMYGDGSYYAGNYNVSYNTFSDCGVYYNYVQNSSLRYNNFSNPNQGIPFYWGTGGNNNLTISNNNFINIGRKNCLGDCDADPTIFNALSFNNFNVVSIQYTTNSVFENNLLDNISGSFRILNSATGNIVRYNNFNGLVLVETRSGGNNNIFYRNNITGNDGIITWGYPSSAALHPRDTSGNKFIENRVIGKIASPIAARGSSSNNNFTRNFVNVSYNTTLFNAYNVNGYWGVIGGLIARDTAYSNYFGYNTLYLENNDLPMRGIFESSTGINNTFEYNNITGGDNSTDLYSDSVWFSNIYTGYLFGADDTAYDPTIDSVQIYPTIATKSSSLRGSCKASSVEHNTLILYGDWFVNGIISYSTSNNSNITEGENISFTTLMPGNFSADDTIIFSCRAYDGWTNSSWLNSSSISILSTLPVISSVSISGNIVSSNILGRCNATDIDGGNVTYEYRWFFNDELYSSGTASDKPEGILTTLSTLTSGYALGDDIIFSCRAKDVISDSYTSWENSSTVEIIAGLPSGAGGSGAGTRQTVVSRDLSLDSIEETVKSLSSSEGMKDIAIVAIAFFAVVLFFNGSFFKRPR